MCEKTTKMYKLVSTQQSSVESSHIMERVGGGDCSGLPALRKKEFRKKIINKNQKFYQRWNEFTQNFNCSIFFFLIFILWHWKYYKLFSFSTHQILHTFITHRDAGSCDLYEKKGHQDCPEEQGRSACASRSLWGEQNMTLDIQLCTDAD